jgi:hypothetical protein
MTDKRANSHNQPKEKPNTHRGGQPPHTTGAGNMAKPSKAEIEKRRIEADLRRIQAAREKLEADARKANDDLRDDAKKKK